MKLILPKNIFTSVLESVLPNDKGFEIIHNESSLICKSLEYNTSAVALIPTLELINHRNLFVSSKTGISFDGALSNSYFYFNQGEKSVQKIYLRGDVSLNEILLAKILFTEMFSSEIDITLDANKTYDKGRDYIVVGDENFNSWDYKSAISIADEVSEMLDHPYVNFVFASHDKEALEDFNNLVDKIDLKIENTIDKIELKDGVKSFITANLNSLYFDITNNEVDAVNELIKLVFYHGIIDDMFDVKFIK